jgi:hypothetical protein
MDMGGRALASAGGIELDEDMTEVSVAQPGGGSGPNRV